MSLTERDKELIKGYIDRGEPLPPKYKLSLFADAPEVELIWQGKTNEVTSVVLPFQSIEQIDEPRQEVGKKMEQVGGSAGLFGVDAATGRQAAGAAGGWSNKLIWGDNKLVLSSLRNGPMRRAIEDAGGLKLVYIDPPFDVGLDFSLTIEVGGEEVKKHQSVIEEWAYRDTWGRGTDSYVAMIYERLALVRGLLHPQGCIFLHVSGPVSQYVKVCMDEIFGPQNFRNEIVLPGRAVKNLQQQFDSIQRLQIRHDVLFWYSNSPDTRYRPKWVKKHDAGNPEGHWHHFWSTADRPTMRYELFGHKPTKGQWVWQESRALKAVANYKRFEKESGGRTLAEYWRDTGQSMEFIRPSPEDKSPQYWREPAEERMADTVWAGVPVYSANFDYPTEKNSKLIAEILDLASEPGDLVADFFMGSGPLAEVAEMMGRKWIGCDLGRFAIHTTRKRLIGVQRQLKAEGKPYRSFEILNLGKYERQYFAGIDPTLPEEQRRAETIRREEHYLGLILTAYKAERVLQSPPFHGKKNSTMVVVGPIDAPVTQSQVAEVVGACAKMRVSKVDVLGFEFEMGLSPQAQDEAKVKGVTLGLKYIPKDVFDRRAVEKGQVKFYDVAYVELKPRVRGRTVSVELADFGVYYEQDAAAAIAEELKPGGSRVAVEAGQVVKVSKDKKGIVSKERLTKKWTDWIDYWAVDFDYESRPEFVRIFEPAPDDPKGYREKLTGGFIFENEWQSFRTRKVRTLELKSVEHEYRAKGKYKIAVKVIDIFGNDTTKVVEVRV